MLTARRGLATVLPSSAEGEKTDANDALSSCMASSFEESCGGTDAEGEDAWPV